MRFEASSAAGVLLMIRRRLGFATLFIIIVGIFSSNALAQFETRSMFTTNDSYSVAVADFNGDGKPDLAVAAINPSIYLGNGDGTFRLKGNYSSVIGPVWVVAGDFNRDGKQDLAFATDLNNSVTILWGNGDGTFSQGPVLKAAASPLFLAVGDVNNDGNLDIVGIETGPGCDCILTFLGNGNGTFDPVIETLVADAVPYKLAIGDFNRDGNLDVAVSEVFGTVDQVAIWTGNGQGSFSEAGSYALGSSPTSVLAADFNGDGNLDLAVSVFEGYAVSILLGNGNGTFEGPVNYSVSFPEDLQAADLNGDHELDLIVGCGFKDTSAACVLNGNGDGTFKTAVPYPVATFSGPVGVGDFNGDGRLDFVMVDGHETGYVWLNTGTAAFSPTSPLNFGKQSVGTKSAAQIVTLTNSGKAELKISSMKAAGQFSVTSTCSKAIVPNKSCTINVTFAPKSQGVQSGTITIIDSASSKPQVIELSGTGT
jgi:hypothetical protein